MKFFVGSEKKPAFYYAGVLLCGLWYGFNFFAG
eukprot:UN20864